MLAGKAGATRGLLGDSWVLFSRAVSTLSELLTTVALLLTLLITSPLCISK